MSQPFNHPAPPGFTVFRPVSTCSGTVGKDVESPVRSGEGTDGKSVFASGAVRSSDAQSTRYDLISPIALRRLAETYAEGARKYNDYNWTKGFPYSDVMNHLQKHLEQWKCGDDSEDHLAHAMFGLATLMHYEETKRYELDDIQYRRDLSSKQPG